LIWTPLITLFPFTMLLLFDPSSFVGAVLGEDGAALRYFYVGPILAGIALLAWRMAARRNAREVSE
jgi:hypothetical protein